MFTLPESIARREESGFRRFGVVQENQNARVVSQHELAHTIDYSEGMISNKPAFQDDAWRMIKSYDPSMTEDDKKNVPWGETWAMWFTFTLDDPNFLPGYITKWYKPYIQRGQERLGH